MREPGIRGRRQPRITVGSWHARVCAPQSVVWRQPPGHRITGKKPARLDARNSSDLEIRAWVSDSHQDREPPEGGGHWYPESPKKKGPIIAAIVFASWRSGRLDDRQCNRRLQRQPNLSAKVDPTLAQGGHDFVNFACSACHGMQGKGGVDASVPVLTTIGSSMTPAQIATIIARRNPRSGDEVRWDHRSVHADLAQHPVRAADQRPRYVHPGRPAGRPRSRAATRPDPARATWSPDRCSSSTSAARTATGPTASVASSTRRLTARFRRSAVPTFRQEFPTKVDQGRHHGRERDRQEPDHQHAALGRHHPRGAAQPAGRLHQYAPRSVLIDAPGQGSLAR